MLKNYLAVALRSLLRDRLYALINVLGLALAIACGTVLTAYIESELTYDQHYADHERIYRILAEFTAGGKTDRYPLAPITLAPMFKRAYPDLIDYTRVSSPKGQVFKSDDFERDWDDIMRVDANYFDLFSHEAVFGDLSNALPNQNSIAVSETFARAHFGDRNPIDETLQSDPFDYRVTAVFEDIPENSHHLYNAVVLDFVSEARGIDDDSASPQQLFYPGTHTYFRARPGVTGQQLQQALDDFYEQYAADIGRETGRTAKYWAQPLADQHYESGWVYDEPTGNVFYLYVFIAIAVFIVLIACINYTNLATARATRRAKEVGLRKILGAERRQLILQFMGESVLYTLAALIVALALIVVAEAYTPINELLDKRQLFNPAERPELLVYVLVGTLLVALLAGAYPALYLSSLPPLAPLGAAGNGGQTGSGLRQALVFFQFFVSISVLAATLIMGLQMHYVANKPLGYDSENKLALTLRGVDVLTKIPVIKNELLNNASVLGVAETIYLPDRTPWNATFNIENNAGHLEVMSVATNAASKEYVDVMGIELVEGRNFGMPLLTDIGMPIIVNEALVKTMGWEEPIGKKIGGNVCQRHWCRKGFPFRNDA